MYQRLGVLKQEKFIFSQFWRLEIQNQGVSKTTLPLKPAGELFLASS